MAGDNEPASHEVIPGISHWLELHLISSRDTDESGAVDGLLRHFTGGLILQQSLWS